MSLLSTVPTFVLGLVAVGYVCHRLDQGHSQVIWGLIVVRRSYGIGSTISSSDRLRVGGIPCCRPIAVVVLSPELVLADGEDGLGIEAFSCQFRVLVVVP